MNAPMLISQRLFQLEKPCGYCGRMAAFFVNENGCTHCAGCEKFTVGYLRVTHVSWCPAKLEPSFKCTVLEFLEANVEGLSVEQLGQIVALQAGSYITIGGGAAPMFEIERLS